MSIKKILCMVLAGSMILPATVSAAENTEDFAVGKEKVCCAKTVQEKAFGMPENFDGVTFDTDISDVVAKISLEEGLEAEADTYTPDKFESNDTLETAIAGKAQHLIQANLHSEEDMDCYKFEVTSDDVSNKVEYTFILSDIPLDCNYDMLIVNGDLEGYVCNSEGNTMEGVKMRFNTAGTYYVVVFSSNGCSESNYSLYYGRSEVLSYYGFAYTNLEIKFGYVPQGTRNPVYMGPYSLDLEDKTEIPENAKVKEFFITAEGTGGNYGGFYKQLYAPDGTKFEQMGGIEKINIPSGKYLVRQNWNIGGSVLFSNYFTWEPRIQVVYTYEVTPATMYYVPKARA